MLKIRLRRMGAIRQPHYRIVVADARAPRDGHFIEILGHYNPRTEPATIQVDVVRYEEWKRKGAQPTDAVNRLVRQFNRAARKASERSDAAAASTPTTDGRTRTASGRRISKGPAAPAVAEAETVAETETEAETVVEATDGASERSDAEAAPVEAEEFPGEEATDEPVLEAATAPPEGAAEGESDTDTAS